jgi:hypothetical protein
MIQILYGHQHQARAEALARAIGGHCGPADKKPILKPGLSTLTFWGHGDPFKFCEMTPDQFVAYVASWKKENKSLKTIELITCNARHATGGADSFTTNFKGKLRKKFSDISIKAMPMGIGTGGKPHIWSILKCQTTTNSWFYVTAPGAKDTDVMWPGVHLVEAEDGADLAIKADAVKKRENLRKFGLEFGYLNTLRATLTTIA